MTEQEMAKAPSMTPTTVPTSPTLSRIISPTAKVEPYLYKIQIRPGKAINLENLVNQTPSNYLSSVPVLSDQPKSFVPIPYTFRVPTTTKVRKLNNLYAKSPPFYVLLDHTLAVIWLIFSEGDFPSHLGIAQLQWALSFLKSIIDRYGQHSEDISYCIQTIEDLLVDHYANLSSEMSILNKIDERTVYFNGVFGSADVAIREIPFSLNYNEMIKRAPDKTDPILQEEITQTSMTAEQIDEQIETLRRADDVDQNERNKAINFLRWVKNDREAKIRMEVRKMESLEKLMNYYDTCPNM